MKTLTLFFAFILSFHSLFAKEIAHKNTENPYLDQTHTGQKFVPTVNPITGELQLEEVDLVVAGSDPISVRRFYSHQGKYDPRYACWRYNPETFFSANFDLGDQQYCFAAIGSFDGGITCLQMKGSNVFTFDCSRHKEASLQKLFFPIT